MEDPLGGGSGSGGAGGGGEGGGGERPPSAKKVRVSVDTLWSDDRQVLCYLEDPANPATVQEQHEPEKDAQETFTQRARQMDFLKYEKRQGEEEGSEARARENQKKRDERLRQEAIRREAIIARMRHALGEMELMFGFIDMAQRGEHLSTAIMDKRPPSVSRSVELQSYAVIAKQKQLQEAAGELNKAADRLRAIVAREKRYCDDLLTLRKEVKLRGRGARSIIAEYALPSSNTDMCDVELRKTRAGEIVVRMAPSRADKSLQVITTHQHATYSLPSAAQGREDVEEARGAAAAIELLSRAQRSQFCTELFRELSAGVSEATRHGQRLEWLWWSSSTHVFENEITFYDASIRARPLIIRLASSRSTPSDGAEWVEGMGEEDTLSISHDGDELKDGEGNIADTLTVILFKLWREHQDQMLQFQQNPAPPVPLARRIGIRMATAVFDAFRHHCLRQRLHIRLRALCAATPFLTVYWQLAASSPALSSFDIALASNVVMNVVVDGVKIVAGSAKPIFSDEEFVEYFLVQLSYRLLRDLHQAAQQEGYQVEKRDLSLIFRTPGDKTTIIEVSFVPLTHAHQLQLAQKVIVEASGATTKEAAARSSPPTNVTHQFFPLRTSGSSPMRKDTYHSVLRRWLLLVTSNTS